MRRRKRKHLLFATFEDFEIARDVVSDLKVLDLQEMVIDDIELYSPIEHPEVEEILGEFHQPIERFSLFGALLGALGAFLFAAAAAQSMFTVQPQGGKPVIPLPVDIVIAYEGSILIGVLSTLVAFFIYSGMPRRLHKYYSEKVSLDQIGIEVQMLPENREKVRAVFEKYKASEIREVTQ